MKQNIDDQTTFKRLLKPYIRENAFKFQNPRDYFQEITSLAPRGLLGPFPWAPD